MSVPFVLRVRYARLLGYPPPRRWGYLVSDRPTWKQAWSRLTWRLHRPQPREDRSDGRDYRGWTARVAFDEDGMLPVGAEGPVVASMRSGGELLHRIELPDHSLTVPHPWPGIDLIPPQGA
ncbi:MAG TPA: hypothetical protein VGJ13_18525 [Pseudonocardiaceae bacterium]